MTPVNQPVPRNLYTVTKAIERDSDPFMRNVMDVVIKNEVSRVWSARRKAVSGWSGESVCVTAASPCHCVSLFAK